MNKLPDSENRGKKNSFLIVLVLFFSSTSTHGFVRELKFYAIALFKLNVRQHSNGNVRSNYQEVLEIGLHKRLVHDGMDVDDPPKIPECSSRVPRRLNDLSNHKREIADSANRSPTLV
jgi:hypothetical protein